MNKVCTLSEGQTILFDTGCIGQVTSELFHPKTEGPEKIGRNKLGRGSVYFFECDGLALVLRHYHRGGMVRHIFKDQYLYTGLESTRMWREFNLLQSLLLLGLPVPKPIAVRCVKTTAISYRGDLITEQIADTQTLAENLACGPLESAQWSKLGAVLAEFHFHNVYHADLNANNILVDSSGRFYLIDFDRCEIREESASKDWKKQNLDRLLRSFVKQQKLISGFCFDQPTWQVLLAAYNKPST